MFSYFNNSIIEPLFEICSSSFL